MSTLQHNRNTCDRGLECKICWPGGTIQHAFKTIRIMLSPGNCRLLADSEEGSYEDMQREEERIYATQEMVRAERPTRSHAYAIALRGEARGCLVIRTQAEADDMYYAVCSGTFRIYNPGTFRSARRIADVLRPFAKPETVKRWPKPEQEEFTRV